MNKLKVTITGPQGGGKTLLAMEIAYALYVYHDADVVIDGERYLPKHYSAEAAQYARAHRLFDGVEITTVQE